MVAAQTGEVPAAFAGDGVEAFDLSGRADDDLIAFGR